MATDFHAHRPKSAARTLVSCRAEELSRYPLASLEFHPWNLPERFEPLSSAFCDAAKSAAALGEFGLDRLRGPSLPVQQEYLEALLELAEALKKPVVIHSVHAVPELLAAFKRHPDIRRLYHGFRGKPELLEELRRAGFYVSLGPAALENAALFARLKAAGLDHIGFETDESPDPVESVIARAAALLNMESAALETQTDHTFDSFLKKTRQVC